MRAPGADWQSCPIGCIVSHEGRLVESDERRVPEVRSVRPSPQSLVPVPR